MVSVTKIMTTETAHRLINYSGKCAHMHGHSYRWEVTAQLPNGSVDPSNDISVDFGDLKYAMIRCIHEPFDHACVLHKNDPCAEMMRATLAADGGGQKIMLLDRNPTAEVFAEMVADGLQQYLAQHHEGMIDITQVVVWETENSFATWQK